MRGSVTGERTRGGATSTVEFFREAAVFNGDFPPRGGDFGGIISTDDDIGYCLVRKKPAEGNNFSLARRDVD